ncbi:uncharacterized protein LOC143276715 [Babylonia areolata]|uniref:uncharacterized protein LOC143276715 n=1 Tax=Babylonia areolata TaxID=304850 RepID=UPI003FD06FE5
MTSVYVRKPRNVRSVYARPRSDHNEGGTKLAGDEGETVGQDEKGSHQEQTRPKNCGQSPKADKAEVAVKHSPGTMSRSSERKKSDSGEKTRRDNAGGPSRTQRCSVRKRCSASTKSKGGKGGKPSASNGSSKDDVGGPSSTSGSDVTTCSVSRQTVIDEARKQSASRVDKESFVSSSTLNLLKHKITGSSTEAEKAPVKPAPNAGDWSVMKQKPYACGICQRRYASDIGLREHEQVHKNQEDADDDGSAQVPGKRNSPVEVFKCDTCNRVFRKKEALTRHLPVHSEVRPYVCDICGKGFSQVGNLTIHVLQHKGERPFVCDVCNKTFLRNFDLQQHKRTHTGERPYVCNICGKAFMVMDYLKTHRQVHNGFRPFKCDICFKTFRRSTQLRTHRQTHTGVRLFECEVCKKRFSSKSVLKKHMHTHSRPLPPPPAPRPKKESVVANASQICEICGVKILKASLKTHMMKHTGERPYVCKVCQKGYITKNEWQIHMRTHTGERPFVCSICGASYPRNENLHRHINGVHLGKKPFVCTVCNRAFADRRNLKDHKLIHLGIRPHKCNECGKRFTQSGSLKSHMRVHTGEKPFACKYCLKSFADMGSRNRHVRTHTGEKPYKCALCPAVFARPEPFKHHRETMHGKTAAEPAATAIDLSTVSHVQVPSASVHLETGLQNVATQSSQIYSYPFGSCASETVVVVAPSGVFEARAAAQQVCDVGAGPVVVVQQGDSPDEAVSATACDILSGPTVIVETTQDGRDSSSSRAGNGDTSVKDLSVSVSGASVICEPLSLPYSSNPPSSSGTEVIECTVVEHTGISETRFTHAEHDYQASAVVGSQVDDKEMVPAQRKARVIEVKIEDSVAPDVPHVESELEHEDDFPGSPANVVEVKYVEKKDVKFEYGEHADLKAEYAESGITVAVIDSHAGCQEAGNAVRPVVGEFQAGFHVKSKTPPEVIESQSISGSAGNVRPQRNRASKMCTDSSETLFLAAVKSQNGICETEKAAGSSVVELQVSCREAEKAVSLAVTGSQDGSYRVENAGSGTVIESQASSDCPPNYIQVCRSGESGSVAIIESQTVFESDPSKSLDHWENASDPRLIDLQKVETIQIVTADPAPNDAVTNNDTSVEDEKPCLESLNQGLQYIHCHTNKIFNKKNKPTTMKMDASVFGDIMKIRKKASSRTEKDWICEICGGGFTQYHALKNHIAVQHRNEGHPYVCDICNKACYARSLLESHRRRHTGERPFSCQQCSNTYKHKSDLRQHIRAAHLGKRPHVCDVCQKAFTERSNLRDHKLIHLGVKPHKCATCGKAFTQSSSLRTHMRIHTGHRPWVCQYCGKDFSDQSSFNRHQRIHTGEKPFRCEHCPCAFARSEQLKKHLSKDHPGDLQNLATLAAAVATIS